MVSRLASPETGAGGPSIATSIAANAGSRLSRPATPASDLAQIDSSQLRRRRPREHEQVLHEIVQAVEPRDDLLDDRGVGGAGRHPAADHLDGATHGGKRVLDLVRDHRRHLANPRERGRFAQPILELVTARQVVEDAGEVRLTVDRHLPHRQVQRKGRAVAAPAGYGAADADDAALSGIEVMLDVAVVAGVIRLGHQHADVAAR